MSLSATTRFAELPSFALIFSPRRFPAPFRRLFVTTLAAGRHSDRRLSTSAPWLEQWPSATPEPPPELTKKESAGAIERIVLRLRNMGLANDGEEDELTDRPLDGDERLGDLLSRNWVRPDLAVLGGGEESSPLPWERDGEGYGEEIGGKDAKRKRVKAPTLAELTIEDSELRRLRREGIVLRERITVPKAGVTQAVLEKIHNSWRKAELVRLKFHESLTHDMKTAHELVERRTGGLIVWRSGSIMVVYRGANYQRPSNSQLLVDDIADNNLQLDGDALFVPDASSTGSFSANDGDGRVLSSSRLARSAIAPNPGENMTEDEKEYNDILDGLGPRFVDWWGTGSVPIDADLLPQEVPGFKTPLRFLPVKMRANLTNAEMTTLRKLARSLPIHFALGRNRNHQGLAAAILKLWEKSTVVKIAVKRGVQNTNNKLMAEEIQKLTGGVLLLRNKYYIVIHRGKDFVPTSVASALAERHEQEKDTQYVEERSRIRTVVEVPNGVNHAEGPALAGTLAEFHEAQARWGRPMSSQELERVKEEALRTEKSKTMKKIEHKLSIAQAKLLRAEKLLAKIEASMLPAEPSDDLETITDEERFMFRRVGLRMKAYLPLGIRGVFDGVIENMHLHWKHRELVKLISKQKTLSFIEDTARLLEYESGGILVAIDKAPKGYTLIYYRGKNYRRPINLRPRNLLTKPKALKRSVAMQRHEALSRHISELESRIMEMKSELGTSDAVDESDWTSEEDSTLDVSSHYKSDDDNFDLDNDDNEDYEDDEDYDEGEGDDDIFLGNEHGHEA